MRSGQLPALVATGEGVVQRGPPILRATCWCGRSAAGKAGRSMKMSWDDCGWVTHGRPARAGESLRDSHVRPARAERRSSMEEERCDCCGRRVSELPPFGGPGDPLVGDFTGEFLIVKYRPHGPYDAEAEAIFARYFDNDQNDLEHKMAEFRLALDYGAEEAERVMMAVYAASLIGRSWECRDCFCFDNDEYFEQLPKRELIGIAIDDLMDADEVVEYVEKLKRRRH